jgi:hypothetical protein
MSRPEDRISRRIEDNGDQTPRASSSRPLRPDQVSGSAHFQHPPDTALGRAERLAENVLQWNGRLGRAMESAGIQFDPNQRSEVSIHEMTEMLGRATERAGRHERLDITLRVFDIAANKGVDMFSETFSRTKDSMKGVLIGVREDDPTTFNSFDRKVQDRFRENETWKPIKDLVEEVERINTLKEWLNGIHSNIIDISPNDSEYLSEYKDTTTRDILSKAQDTDFEHLDRIVQEKLSRDESWGPIEDIVKEAKNEKHTDKLLSKMSLSLVRGSFNIDKNLIRRDIIEMQTTNKKAFELFDRKLQDKVRINEIWEPLVKLVDTLRVVDRT